MSWGYVAVGSATAISSIYSNEAASQGKQAAKKAFRAKKQYLRQAQGIISSGYKDARISVQEKTDKAQGYQDPYLEIGLEAKKYFGELNQPGSISKKYKEYLEVGDPLFDYANKQTSDALQKRLAAAGRTDSGFAIEEDLDRSTKIAYQFSDLADRRLQNEIGLQERLLGRGQDAANTSTQLQYNTGQSLSNLFTRESDINAAYEAQIGGAAATKESAIGNINMSNTSKQGSLWSGAVGAMGGMATGSSYSDVTGIGGGSMPTIASAEGAVGQIQSVPTPQNNPQFVNQDGGSTVPTVASSSGSNLYPSTAPYYTPVSNSMIAAPRTATEVSPMATQNYYSYDPNKAMSRGY